MDEYLRLRGLWFPAVFANHAKVKFFYLPANAIDPQKYAPLDWGYDLNRQELTCLISEADLTPGDDGLAVGGMKDFNEAAGETNEGMYSNLNLMNWANWRWHLVHEVCHEYEHVVLSGVATLGGWQLFSNKVVNPGSSRGGSRAESIP